MIGHERVAEVVNAVEIHREEFPRLRLHDAGGGGLNGDAATEQIGEAAQAAVAFLVHLRGARHEGQEMLLRNLLRHHAASGVGAGACRRMDAARRGVEPAGFIGPGIHDSVRHHHAVERLGGMTGPPADGARMPALLHEDVPDGFAPAAQTAPGAEAAPAFTGLGKPQHAVPVRRLAGGDGIPKHRRDHRLERGQIPPCAPFHQPAQGGQVALGHEGMDQIPVRGIPSDEQQAATRGGHGEVGRREAGLVINHPRHASRIIPGAKNTSRLHEKVFAPGQAACSHGPLPTLSILL